MDSLSKCLKTRSGRRKKKRRPRWEPDEIIIKRSELRKRAYNKRLDILGDIFYSLFSQLRSIDNNSVNEAADAA